MHASKIIKIIIQCIKETSGCVWNLEIIGTQLGKYTLWDCMMKSFRWKGIVNIFT